MALALLPVVTLFTFSTSVTAADRSWLRCPEITDSVTRLYSAYFLRSPDAGGFQFWGDLWSSGAWDLPRVSSHFAASAEFQQLYGSLGNEAFVDLIYRNVLGRPAEPEGFQFWVGQLNTGSMFRGKVMLMFSESPEYAAKSGTTPFFGGGFTTLPPGSSFYCGSGQQVIDVAYNNYTNVFYTASATVLPSSDPYAGGNFMVAVLDRNLASLGGLANEILYWDQAAFGPRSVVRTDILRRYSWNEPGVKIQVGDEDAEQMRWFIVFYPATVRSQPFG